MGSKDEIKSKGPRKKINLCRICSTYSPSMIELTEIFEKVSKTSTIKEVLEKVMCCKILNTINAPKEICSICLSLLRISYELKNQFEKTERKLYRNLCYSKNQKLEENVKSANTVELIVGDNNINLKDFVIDKDDKKDQEVYPNYAQFLDNLEKTLTVEYLWKPSNTENPNETENNVDSTISEKGISNIQALSNDLSKNPFEGEEYETIIIQFVSDTDENSLQDECENKLLKKSECSSLSETIDALIIEGDDDEQHDLQDEEINYSKNERDENLNAGTVEKATPKGEKKGTHNKMKDIEQYIIYETDQEGKYNESKEASQIFNLSHKDSVSESDMGGGITTENNSRNDNDVWENMQNTSEESGNSTNKTTDKHFCKQCLISFDSRWIFKRHLLRAHGIKEGRAPKSKKLPKDIQIRHRIERLKESFRKNPKLCQICGHVSKSSGGAKYHSLTHGEKKYECVLCPKKFYTPSHLKNHFQYKHERKMTPHLCPVCGENRNSSTALAYHMKLHTNEAKKYSCPICDITFVMKSGLNTHIRRHLGDRRYPCSMCDKSFFSTNERKKHLMLHTGDKPHKCKYCERRFVTQFNLKIHMMTHSGPVCCKICFKGLVDEDVLKLHIKYKHCETSETIESSEDPELADEGEMYDKYELLIQSAEDCQDFLEGLNLLSDVQEDSLDFDVD